MITLATVHGPATLWWDAESDPDAPGWVLRWHQVPEGSGDELGRRHLDEILDPDLGEGDETAARRVALVFLGRQGVGAGRQVTGATQAAEVAGLGGASSWRGARWRPAPDDHHDARTPWWWESTILAARASRPGSGNWRRRESAASTP